MIREFDRRLVVRLSINLRLGTDDYTSEIDCKLCSESTSLSSGWMRNQSLFPVSMSELQVRHQCLPGTPSSSNVHVRVSSLKHRPIGIRPSNQRRGANTNLKTPAPRMARQRQRQRRCQLEEPCDVSASVHAGGQNGGFGRVGDCGRCQRTSASASIRCGDHDVGN